MLSKRTRTNPFALEARFPPHINRVRITPAQPHPLLTYSWCSYYSEDSTERGEKSPLGISDDGHLEISRDPSHLFLNEPPNLAFFSNACRSIPEQFLLKLSFGEKRAFFEFEETIPPTCCTVDSNVGTLDFCHLSQWYLERHQQCSHDQQDQKDDYLFLAFCFGQPASTRILLTDFPLSPTNILRTLTSEYLANIPTANLLGNQLKVGLFGSYGVGKTALCLSLARIIHEQQLYDPTTEMRAYNLPLCPLTLFDHSSTRDMNFLIDEKFASHLKAFELILVVVDGSLPRSVQDLIRLLELLGRPYRIVLNFRQEDDMGTVELAFKDYLRRNKYNEECFVVDAKNINEFHGPALEKLLGELCLVGAERIDPDLGDSQSVAHLANSPRVRATNHQTAIQPPGVPVETPLQPTLVQLPRTPMPRQTAVKKPPKTLPHYFCTLSGKIYAFQSKSNRHAKTYLLSHGYCQACQLFNGDKPLTLCRNCDQGTVNPPEEILSGSLVGLNTIRRLGGVYQLERVFEYCGEMVPKKGPPKKKPEGDWCIHCELHERKGATCPQLSLGLEGLLPLPEDHLLADIEPPPMSNQAEPGGDDQQLAQPGVPAPTASLEGLLQLPGESFAGEAIDRLPDALHDPC